MAEEPRSDPLIRSKLQSLRFLLRGLGTAFADDLQIAPPHGAYKRPDARRLNRRWSREELIAGPVGFGDVCWVRRLEREIRGRRVAAEVKGRCRKKSCLGCENAKRRYRCT